MTDIKIPKHLDIKIWKAALYIENSESKEEASNRIDELLKEEGDEFMAYCMAILCLPQLMKMVRHTKEYQDHFEDKKNRQYH
jgi:hypothetical protein